MSAILDQAARLDPQRSRDLDRWDEEMAAADLEEDVQKAARRNAVNDAEAFRLQVNGGVR